MKADLRDHVRELRAEGQRRFSRWDAALFDAAVAGPAAVLARSLAKQPDAEAAVLAYMRVAQQAIGTGVLTQVAPGPTGWSSFLERVLVEVVPERLPSVPAARRSAVLVEVWNLGEGLRREPAWVDRYVNARAAEFTQLDALEAFLVRTLEPVLTPAPPASWAGSCRVNVLDLRPVHDEFLPGRLHLAAPTVLCVKDRRRPELQIAVLLRSGKQSEILGVIAGLGEYADPGPLPRVEFADGKVRLAGSAVREVPVPTLRRCQGFAIARTGFIAACAVDSQRLWVIESD